MHTRRKVVRVRQPLQHSIMLTSACACAGAAASSGKARPTQIAPDVEIAPLPCDGTFGSPSLQRSIVEARQGHALSFVRSAHASASCITQLRCRSFAQTTKGVDCQRKKLNLRNRRGWRRRTFVLCVFVLRAWFDSCGSFGTAGLGLPPCAWARLWQAGAPPRRRDHVRFFCTCAAPCDQLLRQ